MKLILLHGTDGDSSSNWLPWLKQQLERRGHTVYVPSLPNSAFPNGEAWSNFVIDNVPFEIDEETVIVGHSAGAALIPMLLQKLPEGVKVKKAILVSGFHTDLGWDKLKDLQNVVVDYDKARQKVGEFILVHSDDDPYVPLAEPEWLASKLGGRLRLIKGQGHFNLGTSPKYKEFPKLLAMILKEEALQRLYLVSSWRGQGVADMVMADIEKLLGKKPSEIKISYITTAGNLHPEDARGWIVEGREILMRRGWQVFDYDIAGKTEAEVEAELEDKDVVFVQGGQCIYMLEQVQKCNFEAVVRRALARGVPYIGESTGAIITGQDVSPYTYLSKDSREHPPVLESYRGLGLVNFLIKPHWNRQEKYQSYASNIIENFEKFYAISEPMIFLNDDQLVYVEGDTFQIWRGQQ